MTHLLGKLGITLVGAFGLAMVVAFPIGNEPPTDEKSPSVIPNSLVSTGKESTNSLWVDSLAIGPLSISTSRLGPGLASFLLLVIGGWPLAKMLISKREERAPNTNNNESNQVAENMSQNSSSNSTCVETATLTAQESNSLQTIQNTINVGIESRTDLSNSRFDHVCILEAIAKGYELGAVVSLHTVLADSVNKSKANLRSVANEFKEEVHAQIFKLGKRDQLLDTCENLRAETDFFWLIQARVDYGGCFQDFVDCTNSGSERTERLLRRLRKMIREYPTGADVSGTIEQEFKDLYREIADELNKFAQELGVIEDKARNNKSDEYVTRQKNKAFGELTQLKDG